MVLTKLSYSAFQIDEPHRHNQNLVGTLDATSLLWSTDIKNAVGALKRFIKVFGQLLLLWFNLPTKI